MEDQDVGANRYLQLPEIATASLPAAAAGNEGGIVYDATTNSVKVSNGSAWVNQPLSGSIANADIVASAAIATSKLANVPSTTVTAGTAAVASGVTSAIFSVATDAATDCTLTLDSTANSVGADVSVVFTTDGGKNLVVSRGGSDVIQTASGADIQTITFEDAKDFGVFRKVAAGTWICVINKGGTEA